MHKCKANLSNPLSLALWTRSHCQLTCAVSFGAISLLDVVLFELLNQAD